VHIATHCDTLQHTAALCNTLHRVLLAVTEDNPHAQHPCCVHTIPRCNTLQHAATHCNMLQHTEKHCSTPQQIATYCACCREKKNRTKRSYLVAMIQNLDVLQCCSVLLCVAVCCSVLQCVAVCCNMHPIWIHDADVDPLVTLLVCKSALCVRSMNLLRNMVSRRGGGLGSSTIFKKFNEPYAPL